MLDVFFDSFKKFIEQQNEKYSAETTRVHRLKKQGDK